MRHEKTALAQWLANRIAALEMLGRTPAGALSEENTRMLECYQLALNVLTSPPAPAVSQTQGWPDVLLIKQIMADGAEKVAQNIRICLDEFPQMSHDIVEECARFADETAEKLRAGL